MDVTEEQEIAAVASSSNHGVQWLRGKAIGRGTFGSVYMATLKRSFCKHMIFPPTMAIKSAEVSDSETLQKEKQNYDNLHSCESLIQCFGEETTYDDHGRMIFNLLLEFASGGDLANRIKTKGGKGMPEIEVRQYTRSIIKGLIHIHKAKYVHCDLKPSNILLVSKNSSNGQQFTAKIGDLGLARRISKTKPWYHLRGTTMYMAPETLIHGEQGSPSDIWALGCTVLEMLTGCCPWTATSDEAGIEKQIMEKPKIPKGLSKEAIWFLKCCFVKKPEFRFTAEMLMNLPFVTAVEEEEQFLTAPTFVEIERRSSKRQRVSIKIVRKSNNI